MLIAVKGPPSIRRAVSEADWVVEKAQACCLKVVGGE